MTSGRLAGGNDCEQIGADATRETPSPNRIGNHVRVTPGRLRITIERDAAAGDIAAVSAGLREFNIARIGQPDDEPVHLFARDADGQVVAGLLGEIRWRWLHVGTLWVAESWRGQGYGAALLQRAERHARFRGCSGVYLDTFEYQARPFYEKLGYELFGTLEGYPPGYRQYHLAKIFDEE